MATLRREQIGFGARLGSGSQGTVYRVARVTGVDFAFPLIFKEFHANTPVSGPGLALLTRVRDDLTPEERAVIDRLTVWPVAVVEELGRACGYVMQAIPDPFMQALATSAGTEHVPREVQHLFVPEAVQRRTMGEAPTTAERLAIAREMAFVLGFLHAKDLVYGDVSYKNAVFTVRPRPALMLLDCDGVRKVGQAAAMPQLHSPGWNPPESGPQTKDTDRYKLGLFILRSLATGANAQTRDPEAARPVLGAAGVALLRRSLSDDPKARVTGREWVEHLDGAIRSAGGVVSRAGPPPPPPRPARQQTADEARRRRPQPAVTATGPAFTRQPPPVLLGQGPRPRPRRVRPGQVHSRPPTPPVWNRFTSAPQRSPGTRPGLSSTQKAIFIGWLLILALAAVGAVVGLVVSSNDRGAGRGSSPTASVETTTIPPAALADGADGVVEAADVAVPGEGWVPVSLSSNGSYGPLPAAAEKARLSDAGVRWVVQYAPARQVLPSGGGSLPLRNVEVRRQPPPEVTGPPPTIFEGRTVEVGPITSAQAMADTEVRVADPVGGWWTAPGLPADYAARLAQAAARVSTSSRQQRPVEVAYQCDLERLDGKGECAWAFRFEREVGTREDVFVSADGLRQIARPSWYRPPCPGECP